LTIFLEGKKSKKKDTQRICANLSEDADGSKSVMNAGDSQQSLDLRMQF